MDTQEPVYDRDHDHLRLLSIFHYIVGGFTLVFSCLFILYIVMGLVMYLNPQAFHPPQQADSVPPMPKEFGLFVVAFGSFALLFGWAYGILTIISGRMIGRLRGRVFSLVIAGLNCLLIPFGTALGICTFIVLLRESVRKLYQDSSHLAGPG
jgi:MFS family permease